jgi:hypothetical protein
MVKFYFQFFSYDPHVDELQLHASGDILRHGASYPIRSTTKLLFLLSRSFEKISKVERLITGENQVFTGKFTRGRRSSRELIPSTNLQ